MVLAIVMIAALTVGRGGVFFSSQAALGSLLPEYRGSSGPSGDAREVFQLLDPDGNGHIVMADLRCSGEDSLSVCDGGCGPSR